MDYHTSLLTRDSWFESRRGGFPNMDPKINRIISVCFNNNPEAFTKSMWRMSKGCREYAYHLALSVCLRYGFSITEEDFDWACAELAGGGCEIEWKYWNVSELGGIPGFKQLL